MPWATSPSPTIFCANPQRVGFGGGRRQKVWDASRICVSSFRRGHANLHRSNFGKRAAEASMLRCFWKRHPWCLRVGLQSALQVYRVFGHHPDTGPLGLPCWANEGFVHRPGSWHATGSWSLELYSPELLIFGRHSWPVLSTTNTTLNTILVGPLEFK